MRPLRCTKKRKISSSPGSSPPPTPTRRPTNPRRRRPGGEQLTGREPALRDKQERLRELTLLVPNIPGPDEPVGQEEEANTEVRRWGEQPQFGLQPRVLKEQQELYGTGAPE